MVGTPLISKLWYAAMSENSFWSAAVVVNLVAAQDRLGVFFRLSFPGEL